jgi:hypothetical protein
VGQKVYVSGDPIYGDFASMNGVGRDGVDGVGSNEPWFVNVIEPNLPGATAIAEHWYELLTAD